jgi:hypothetical protein
MVLPKAIAPRAIGVAEGTAAVGLRVTLDGRRSTGSDLHYRWVQTRGMAVTLDDPTAAVARFTVPEGAGILGFLLLVANAGGTDTTPITIPVERRGAAPAEGLHADAGDDQIAVIGHQVTLNGIRSAPRGKIGYRWIQIGGPPVPLNLEDGYIYVFAPREAGLYRFALVVAEGGAISEPDTVDVIVQAAQTPTPAPGPIQPALDTTDLARASLAALDGGPAAAGALAGAFDAIVERAGLYESYNELLSEMSRSLEEIVPKDPARRATWTQQLFMPLTVRLVDGLRAQGLDLLQPAGQSAPLTKAHKDHIAEQLRAMAKGFRSLQPPAPGR